MTTRVHVWQSLQHIPSDEVRDAGSPQLTEFQGPLLTHTYIKANKGKYVMDTSSTGKNKSQSPLENWEIRFYINNQYCQ